jgi:sporulation protein YqfC
MKQRFCPSEIPPIEMTGNCRVRIGCCDGILEYEPESVKLRAGKRQIRIDGQGLDLCNLTENTVLVRGLVFSLTFEG